MRKCPRGSNTGHVTTPAAVSLLVPLTHSLSTARFGNRAMINFAIFIFRKVQHRHIPAGVCAPTAPTHYNPCKSNLDIHSTHLDHITKEISLPF